MVASDTNEELSTNRVKLHLNDQLCGELKCERKKVRLETTGDPWSGKNIA